jgi:hypothetical protein
MTQTSDAFRIRDGVVTTEPAQFDEAIATVAREKLHGVMLTNDFGPKQPGPPRVDLSRLLTVPFIEEFGFSPGFDPKRLVNFEALYELRNLKKLGMHSYLAVDLSRFAKLEMLFLTDGRRCTGLGSLSELQQAHIWRLEAPDLSFVATMPRLAKLRLIQLRHQRIQGLDRSPKLSSLDISHSSKLVGIGGIPQCLASLSIKRCAKLRDLAFLAHHPKLEFLYVDVMADLALVPQLPMLAYVSFENVLDGDLSPLLKSASLTKVGFHPAKRKHYSHALAEIQKLLAGKEPKA